MSNKDKVPPSTDTMRYIVWTQFPTASAVDVFWCYTDQEINWTAWWYGPTPIGGYTDEREVLRQVSYRSGPDAY